MTDTTAILARLRAATGPDRSLDAEIARSFGWKQLNTTDRWWPAWMVAHAKRNKKSLWSLGKQPTDLPAYTASHDAALSLVPEGWAVDGLTIWPGGRPSLRLTETAQGSDGDWWHDSRKHKQIDAEAATAPLAVLIAAITAREARG